MLPQDTSTSEQPQGRWQWTLRELLISSWVTGLLMLIATTVCPPELKSFGIIFALILGFYFAAIVLVNARRGHELAFMRVSGALGLILIIGGVAMSIMALAEAQAVYDEFKRHADLRYDVEPSLGWGWIALTGALCIVTGAALVWMVASYLAAPKASHQECEETLRRLLDVKKTAQR